MAILDIRVTPDPMNRKEVDIEFLEALLPETETATVNEELTEEQRKWMV